MVPVKRLNVLVLTSLLISCGTNFPYSFNPDKKQIYRQGINSPVSGANLNKSDITSFHKEFLSFNTKALSASYLQRKLIKLIGNDNGLSNGNKIVKQLEYARYKNETAIFFQAICSANPTLYLTITGISAVISERAVNPSFDSFILNSKPVSVFGGVVTTLAGNDFPGFIDSNGTAARFNSPVGLTVDLAGNVFVADQNNQRIRKITGSGFVTTLAGNNNAGFIDATTGTSAQFKYPSGVAADASGNVFVADYLNHRIRKITSIGEVTTLAGSTQGFNDATGTDAMFNGPLALTVDLAGNIFVADYGNNKIRKITSGGVVTTFAGSTPGYNDATGTDAQFSGPYGIAVDKSGNIYVPEYFNQRIRKITSTGLVTTFAGSTQGFNDGTGTNAMFNFPYGVAVDTTGNVYVTDSGNNRIRKITGSGEVITLAGNSNPGFKNGIGTIAEFSGPSGIAVDSSGNIYVSDYSNIIRKIQ